MGVQHEMNISLYDLQAIMVDLIGTNTRVYIKVKDEHETDEAFFIIGFEVVKGEVKVESQTSEKLKKYLPMSFIEQIEFEFHYTYRNESAKIFRVI
jgi:hypothetical protein